jgi:hypothetical protein
MATQPVIPEAPGVDSAPLWRERPSELGGLLRRSRRFSKGRSRLPVCGATCSWGSL